MSDSAAQATTSGKIVWFEVPAGDTARARSFYGDLFGWQFQPYEGQDNHMTYEARGAIFAAPKRTGPMPPDLNRILDPPTPGRQRHRQPRRLAADTTRLLVSEHPRVVFRGANACGVGANPHIWTESTCSSDDILVFAPEHERTVRVRRL